jgi:hypothetical protein
MCCWALKKTTVVPVSGKIEMILVHLAAKRIREG